ncbi:autotransporter outer membrane beta-barrel domain-containing protein [Escherichia coli]|nr:autotransporter outer membrane beta-barrel domain-containing protein [Escherichia coli]
MSISPLFRWPNSVNHFTQDGARNIAEIKTGVEGQLNANLNVWGNVGVQVADRGYNDTSAMVGIKWQF